MKNLLFTIILTAAFISAAFAQVNVDVKKKVNSEANHRANRQTDKAVDKAFDKLEDGIGGLFKKKEKVSDDQSSGKTQQNTKTESQPTEKATESEDTTERQLQWAKYDFVPGTEIIFEDNQENEQNGEFPSKWDLKAGTIENAFFDGSNVIFFRETGNSPNGIVPLMKNSKEDYLPEEFTIEFDAYFAANKFNRYYSVYLYDSKNQRNNNFKRLIFDINKVEYGTGEIQKQFPNTERSNTDKVAKWRHIAISFNKRALKAYMDDTRMINIPNITENPTGVTIGAYNHRDGEFFIKNIRIAKGAVPLYDKFLTDGKFVTTGIKFDVNKATIKTESMGTINYVVKMMQEHPELRFSVEGHTDSDGEENSNQKLSELRAQAVTEKLIGMGIAGDRLKSTGWGESKPVSDNGTTEGKANNRRVEFVKY